MWRDGSLATRIRTQALASMAPAAPRATFGRQTSRRLPTPCTHALLMDRQGVRVRAADDRVKGVCVCVCDKNGCDIHAHRLGVHNFFGPCSDFHIDSTKPVQVTTQLITNDGTD